MTDLPAVLCIRSAPLSKKQRLAPSSSSAGGGSSRVKAIDKQKGDGVAGFRTKGCSLISCCPDCWIPGISTV